MTIKVLRYLLKGLAQLTAGGTWSFSPKQLSPVKILSPNGSLLPFQQKNLNRLF